MLIQKKANQLYQEYKQQPWGIRPGAFFMPWWIFSTTAIFVSVSGFLSVQTDQQPHTDGSIIGLYLFYPLRLWKAPDSILLYHLSNYTTTQPIIRQNGSTGFLGAFLLFLAYCFCSGCCSWSGSVLSVKLYRYSIIDIQISIETGSFQLKIQDNSGKYRIFS